MSRSPSYSGRFRELGPVVGCENGTLMSFRSAGIGASAGAVESFFRAYRARFGQYGHGIRVRATDPGHASLLMKILSKRAVFPEFLKKLLI
jgi:hypothetical protein